ncbi:MAG TPA: radical SAM protein [Myxococcota bacterium]|nr:radical SAM protein [Myxococcota bacterium]
MPAADQMQKVREMGIAAGLGQAEVDRAMGKILGALASVTSTSGLAGGADGARLLAGLNSNLADNPMLVAWGLSVAARSCDRVFSRFIDNFLLGMVFDRKPVVEAMGYHPPITLVINPTMRCNLRCTGCYAYSYGQKADMDRALLGKVLDEARDLGIAFVTVTGGEPFLYPEIEEVFAKYSDITFMVYTNGQFIDAERSRRLAELGNVWPAISVEGFEAETDARRGKGVYQKLTAAMHHLRRDGVLFGISAVPTRKNTELLASDAFLDHYIDMGALFGWMFTYMPVGRDPDPSLMATPEQRDFLRRKSLEWRRTKPFFLADFWNDGPLCGGCMSASRFAFISNEGWVQPCVFVHFATHNVKDHTLREIFDSEFFQAIRKRQPYHPNLLRPCKIIDHPQVLEEVVRSSGARPTYPGADSILKNPAIRDHLMRYSREYAVLADRAWAGEDYQSGHSVQVPFYGRCDLYKIYDWRMKRAHEQQDEKFPVVATAADERRKYSAPHIKA